MKECGDKHSISDNNELLRKILVTKVNIYVNFGISDDMTFDDLDKRFAKNVKTWILNLEEFQNVMFDAMVETARMGFQAKELLRNNTNVRQNTAIKAHLANLLLAVIVANFSSIPKAMVQFNTLESQMREGTKLFFTKSFLLFYQGR